MDHLNAVKPSEPPRLQDTRGNLKCSSEEGQEEQTSICSYSSSYSAAFVLYLPEVLEADALLCFFSAQSFCPWELSPVKMLSRAWVHLMQGGMVAPVHCRACEQQVTPGLRRRCDCW